MTFLNKIRQSYQQVRAGDVVKFPHSGISDDDEFKCTSCHKVFDIEDSIQIGDDLYCEKCAKKMGVKVEAAMESQKLGKKSLTSFNLDIMTKIVKGLPQFHFSKMNYTASGIEGEFLYRQPDGKAGRYHMEIKKVGMT